MLPVYPRAGGATKITDLEKELAKGLSLLTPKILLRSGSLSSRTVPVEETPAQRASTAAPVAYAFIRHSCFAMRLEPNVGVVVLKRIIPVRTLAWIFPRPLGSSAEFRLSGPGCRAWV